MPDREVYHQSRQSQVKNEQDDRDAFGRQARATMRWVKARDNTNSRVTAIAVANEGRVSGKVTLTSMGRGSSAPNLSH
jgi:hypothetical protein